MASSSESVESGCAQGERDRKKKNRRTRRRLCKPLREVTKTQKVYFTVAIIDQRETTRLGS